MKSAATAVVAILTFVLVVLLIGLLYVYSGEYNVAATDEHADLVHSSLNTLKRQSIRSNSKGVSMSLPTDSAAFQRGFRAYDQMCVPCHGAPGIERGWMGKGMSPQPPDLSHVAEEFSPEEIYWVIRHGIKLAGMPALEPTHSDESILELAAFVAALEEMTEQEYADLGAAAAQDTAANAVHAHDGHVH